jgi:cholesterol transport system auxiliary component
LRPPSVGRAGSAADRRRRRVRFGGGLAWAAAVLAGCALGEAPRDHFYRLEAEAPAALSEPALVGTLRVDRLRAEALLDERRIQYRAPGASEIGRYSYHYWADAPTLLLEASLVHCLREARLADAVVPAEVRVSPDYVLGGRLRSLERVADPLSPRVRLELDVYLVAVGDDRLLFQATYAEERGAENPGLDAASAAWNRALTRIVERLVADLAQVGKGRASSRDPG